MNRIFERSASTIPAATERFVKQIPYDDSYHIVPVGELGEHVGGGTRGLALLKLAKPANLSLHFADGVDRRDLELFEEILRGPLFLGRHLAILSSSEALFGLDILQLKALYSLLKSGDLLLVKTFGTRPFEYWLVASEEAAKAVRNFR